MSFIRRHRVFVVLVALGVLVAVLVAERVRKQQAAAIPHRQLEIVVGVTRPIRKDLDVKLAYTADVLPNQQVAIFSKVSGYIKRLGADLGDFVKPDQLLVEIEAPELSAAVEQVRTSVATAQANLDNTRILAPFAGYISARNLYPGAAVSSQQAGTSTQAVGVLMLQDIASVKVQLEVQEKHISLVRLGSTARVFVDAYPDRLFEARATRIVHALDPRTRTLGVEMEIANPDLQLKPGMYARVELLIDRHPGAILVPSEAVTNEGDVPVVFVVDPSGVVGRRTIATGAVEGTLVEVTKGLQGSEAVIVDGKELVREGQKVRAEVKK